MLIVFEYAISCLYKLYWRTYEIFQNLFSYILLKNIIKLMPLGMLNKPIQTGLHDKGLFRFSSQYQLIVFH